MGIGQNFMFTTGGLASSVVQYSAADFWRLPMRFACRTLQTKVAMAVDSNNKSIAIFLDLYKAFGSVDHNILLDKLFVYGMGLEDSP